MSEQEQAFNFPKAPWWHEEVPIGTLVPIGGLWFRVMGLGENEVRLELTGQITGGLRKKIAMRLGGK